MPKKSTKKVGFISSFLPNQCGIATFTSDLISSLSLAGGDKFEPLVVAMQPETTYQYAAPVKFEIRSKVKNDYISAADYINFSHVDIISLQHEFGLFGGSGGSHLNLLLHRVNAPVITTLHTVLEEPEPHYYQSMIDVCEASHKIIVMNDRGVTMLRDIYGVSEKKIELIPHGIPDLPFVDSSYYKHKFGMDGRKTILTFGLLSQNKGIELMLEALPKIVAADPTVLYIILGTTHPGVIRHEGEAYRFSLKRMVKDLGLQDNVIFHNRFVNSERLHNFLCAADIYVTPYSNKQQLTSGTLAFAVGTGKAVVSTPYWAAEELLANDRGRLVNFDDPENLADTVIDIIQDDAQFDSLRRKSYDYGRDITWPMIGKKYWKLITGKQQPVRIATRRAVIEEAVSILEVPEPPLNHLIRMSDGTGLLQHAKFITPDRDHGYCTDDNSRAMIAMTKYYAQYAEPEALRLFDTYLSFVFHAQRADGTVRNFMSYDRNWIKGEPSHDSLGRTLWAFGTAMAKPPMPKYLPIIKDCFDKSVSHVPCLSMRGKSYAVFGMADYLQQFPGASDIKRHITMVADELVGHYESNSSDGWQWFEDILTYDNAVLPHALYLAAMITGDPQYLDVAQKTCGFLMENTFNGDHFSFIGCKGWYERNGERAYFDQQPLEVASTTMMLKAAFDATDDREYLRLQRKAFHWFLGENDLHIPVYDFKTKGSADGLESSGLNLNQGAESMLSFLLSLLCTVEGYSTSPKSRVKNSMPLEKSEMKKHPALIKEISAKPKLSINAMDKPA
jgi:glycosyltransferase involved in cell wall biosynthesis